MSEWIERVKQSPVWEKMEELGPAIDEALKREPIEPAAIDGLERIRSVLAYTGRRLASADPVLISPSPISHLSTYLSQIRTSVDNFATSGEQGELASANVKADELLAVLPSIPSVATQDDLVAIHQAATSYRQTLQQYLTEAHAIQSEVSALSAANSQKLLELSETLNAEQQRLATLSTEQQSQFSAAQDKRNTDFTSSQSEQLTKFSSASNEFQTQFSAEQDTRRSTFLEFQSASQEKVSALMTEASQQLAEHEKEYIKREKDAYDSYTGNLQQFSNDYQEDANKILAEMEGHKEKIESLVGVIGNLGVTSGYLKAANLARIQMFVWQTVTVLALVGLITVAFFTVFPNGLPIFNSVVPVNPQEIAKAAQPVVSAAAVKPDADAEFYRALAARIFLSITFGVLAAYAGRQASHFMWIEQKNRKLALELEALGPFIEPLSEEDRNKFRILVGEKSFAASDHAPQKAKDEDPTNVVTLLKSKEIQDYLTGLVRDAMKSVKGAQ